MFFGFFSVLKMILLQGLNTVSLQCQVLMPNWFYVKNKLQKNVLYETSESHQYKFFK